MKKIIILMVLSFTCFSANAQSPEFTEEVEAYGAIGGLAYACKIDQELKTYEAIVGDLIINRSENDSNMLYYKKVYASSKKRFYEAHMNSPEASCVEIRNDFFNQAIFKFRKNPDGSMIAPDGTIFRKIY